MATKRLSAGSRGYDARWRSIRRRFLHANPTCVLCGAPATVADHFPRSRRELLAAGIRDPDRPEYLRPLCTVDHNRETAKHQPGGWAARPSRSREAERHPGLLPAAAPAIAIVGPPASGKTTLAEQLQRRTGWTYLAIDQEQSWATLLQGLARLGDTPLIIESVALPPRYRAKLVERNALLVAVHVPESVRRQRLEARGDEYQKPLWDDRRQADLIVSGRRQADLDEVVARAKGDAGFR